ncbi:MAG: hypothetical protein JKY11_07490 [Alphaproteobacteria bacterium]|nr:hypothetical protein [Alphaproteobacteria bacterium]
MNFGTTKHKELPANLTSYDLLKTLALIIMIVDHVGMYLLPENEWLRVIGRMCVPMWFFLVGYAKSRDVSPSLWLGGGILLVANMVTGFALLPLNILFSILAVRLIMDPFFTRMFVNRSAAFMGLCVMATFNLPLFPIIEYGMTGLALALVGYMARHKEELGFSKLQVALWINLVAVFFWSSQVLAGFMFPPTQVFVMLGGGTAVIWALYLFFEPKTFSIKIPAISFLGRHTLEIYVLHLITFKVLAVHLGIGYEEWLNVYLGYTGF